MCLRRRSRWHLLPLQHPQRDRQDLIAIAVHVIGDRTKNDAAAVGGIDLLLFAGAAMDVAIWRPD